MGLPPRSSCRVFAFHFKYAWPDSIDLHQSLAHVRQACWSRRPHYLSVIPRLVKSTSWTRSVVCSAAALVIAKSSERCSMRAQNTSRALLLKQAGRWARVHELEGSGDDSSQVGSVSQFRGPQSEGPASHPFANYANGWGTPVVVM